MIAGARNELSTGLDSSNPKLSAESVAVGSGLEETRSVLQALREETREVDNVANEGMAAAQGYAREIRLLRSEVQQLREETAAVPPLGDSAFRAQDIEILTNNIYKIGSRENQVEGLQWEFQLLNGRVQRLERFPGPEHRPVPGAGNVKNLASMDLREAHQVVSAPWRHSRQRRGPPRQTGRHPPESLGTRARYLPHLPPARTQGPLTM